ncbi:hypothetical protein GGE68_001843 [Rhizobium leguminosarum]|uniref:hypothetical protein n=1 Tax=Rhizobium leguminosarum TaxID=384 RepID=UPI00161698E0|nr:hypothetical protein [Rhizobium leguminosarum]MBB5663653.1 hypothetical protein [Rhizobium leguminosarum]
MKPIELADLEPSGYYWALRDIFLSDGADELEIVQISTVFGETYEYLSVAVLGSDQHYSLKDFVFFAKIDVPAFAPTA